MWKHISTLFKKKNKKPASDTIQVIKVEEPEWQFTLTGVKLKHEAFTPHSESLNIHETKPAGKPSQEVNGFKPEIH